MTEELSRLSLLMHKANDHIDESLVDCLMSNMDHQADVALSAMKTSSFSWYMHARTTLLCKYLIIYAVTPLDKLSSPEIMHQSHWQKKIYFHGTLCFQPVSVRAHLLLGTMVCTHILRLFHFVFRCKAIDLHAALVHCPYCTSSRPVKHASLGGHACLQLVTLHCLPAGQSINNNIAGYNYTHFLTQTVIILPLHWHYSSLIYRQPSVSISSPSCKTEVYHSVHTGKIAVVAASGNVAKISSYTSGILSTRWGVAVIIVCKI